MKCHRMKILEMATGKRIILEQGSIALIQWENERENRGDHPARGFLDEQLNLSK